MAAQPQFEGVTRGRGDGYALAASRALPGEMQVADRWHLMENASQAFVAATRGSMRQIPAELEIAAIDSELPTAVERLQSEGYLRREDANASVLALRDAGVAIKGIVRRIGHSRGMVRQVLRGERCSAPGNARSTSTCLRWTPIGKPASAEVQLCGGSCAA